jgi:hypothetical protein
MPTPNVVSSLTNALGLQNNAPANAANLQQENYDPFIQQGLNQSGQTNAEQNTLAQALQQQAQGQGYANQLAQEQLQAATNRNQQQTAGQIASTRGMNPAQAARLILQNNANVQQQAANQSAQNTAQGSLAAQNQLANVLGTQGQQAIGAVGTGGGLLNQQNTTNVNNTLGAEQLAAGIAGQNVGLNSQVLGGLASGAAGVGAAQGLYGAQPAATAATNAGSLGGTAYTGGPIAGGASTFTQPALGAGTAAADTGSDVGLGAATTFYRGGEAPRFFSGGPVKRYAAGGPVNQFATTPSFAQALNSYSAGYQPTQNQATMNQTVANPQAPDATVTQGVSNPYGANLSPIGANPNTPGAAGAGMTPLQALQDANAARNGYNLISGAATPTAEGAGDAAAEGATAEGGADLAGAGAAGAAGTAAAAEGGADILGTLADVLPFLALAAKGGKIGNPMKKDGLIPGDHPKNDIVPAMLSPKEIVLPRSVTMSANPAEEAKEFVQKIKGKADGGVIKDTVSPTQMNDHDQKVQEFIKAIGSSKTRKSPGDPQGGYAKVLHAQKQLDARLKQLEQFAKSIKVA